MQLESKMGLWIPWYLKSIKTYISLHVALVLFRATLIFQPTSSDKAWDNFLSTTMKFTFWVNKWMKIRISCCSIHTCEILILFSSRWNTLSALLSLHCRATGINMLAIPREKCQWLKGTTNYTHSAHAQVWVPSLWWNLDFMTFVNRLVTKSQPFECKTISDSF